MAFPSRMHLGEGKTVGLKLQVPVRDRSRLEIKLVKGCFREADNVSECLLAVRAIRAVPPSWSAGTQHFLVDDVFEVVLC